MYKISKEFKFEAAHLLAEHNGKCINLHGHSYKLIICVCSDELNCGMVTDFSDLKSIVSEHILNKVDHAFIYDKNSSDDVERKIAQLLLDNNRYVYALDCRVTAENMARHFFEVLKIAFKNERYNIHSVTVYETDTSFAEYTNDDRG